MLKSLGQSKDIIWRIKELNLPHMLDQRHRTKLIKKRQSSRAYLKLRYSQDPQTKKEASQKYCVSNKESVCSYKRDKCALSEPKPAAKDAYMNDLHSHMLGNTKAKAHLITAYKKKKIQSLINKVTGKAVCTIAAKRLLNKVLQVRKEHAGSLLKVIRTIQSMQIKGAEDFGEGNHTASTEPYFYDSAYKPVKRNYALPIDECGKCILVDEIIPDNKSSKCSGKNQPMKWVCTSECKKTY